MATIPSLPLFTSGPLTSGKLNRLRDVIALWQNPPAAMARASASQNITSGGYQLVTFHTTEFDTDTIVTSTTRFTVKTAGRYIISATATFITNGTGARYVEVRKNAAGVAGGGTLIGSGAAAPSGASSTTVSIAPNIRASLAVNDTLEVFVQQTSGSTLTLNSSPGDTFMLLQLDSVTATMSGAEATNIQSLHAESDLSTGDLDSVLSPGNYVQATAANATLARHYPVASVGGHLQVYSDGTASPTTTTQMFETTANALYIRHRAGTTWSAWVAISGGGGSSTLAGLTDVNTAGATDTQSLSWDTTTSKWIPESKAAAVHTHAATDIASGTIATARLGSGTASASTFLRGDNTWATPAGGGFPATYSGGPVGANVYPPGCNGAGTGALIGNQPAGARIVWFPIQLGACTITGFTVNVTTAGDGASVIKVGLYDDYAGVRPKSLLTTLGTVSSTTTGTKTLTGASYAWAGGTLWVGAVEQAHTSTCAQVTNDAASFPVASSQAINTTFQAIAQDSVTSTLPANATGENALVTNRPRVWLTIQ